MEYLTRDELRKLFQAAYDRNRQHHLAMLVAYAHGLRVSEVVALTGSNIVDGKLVVKRLKGSKKTSHAIQVSEDRLFDESPLLAMAGKKRDRLFPFSRQRADQFIKRYAELAGVHPSKAHMHAMKHSAAIAIWNETHSLGIIQNYLGHKAASSSLVYLAEVDSQKGQDAMARVLRG